MQLDKLIKKVPLKGNAMTTGYFHFLIMTFHEKAVINRPEYH